MPETRVAIRHCHLKKRRFFSFAESTIKHQKEIPILNSVASQDLIALALLPPDTIYEGFEVCELMLL
jgi:hypothetical protein